MAMNFGILDFAVAFNRQTAFPLDAKSYFESYDSAVAAAQAADEAGSKKSVYYYGQVVSVVENGTAKLYIIQPDKTLKEAGGEIVINENVFAKDENGKLDLLGFAAATAGAQLVKGSDGKISWVAPSGTTVEGLDTRLTVVENAINGTGEGETRVPGLVEKIGTLETNLANVYTKEEVNQKLSSVLNYKGSVDNYSDLPADAVKGDVYNVKNADTVHGVKAGDNVAYDGTSWDVLAGTIEMSGYLTKTEAETTYVAKEEGKTLISAELIEKLTNMNADGEKNVINAVSEEFSIDAGTRTLSLATGKITQDKIAGLAEALAEKVNAETGKGLSTNDFTNDLKSKLDAIEAGAQANVIENVSMNGEALVIAEKGVNIPLATNTTVGVIKGSDVENGVVIDEQGAASVKNLNVGKLVQTDGDWLILNGGNSTLTVE
jgi:hypothetical protein